MGKAKRAGARRELHINRDWCKGCNICVRLCPTGVLGMDGEEKAVVLDIERCTWCRSCELHCPDLAIEILAAENPETVAAPEQG